MPLRPLAEERERSKAHALIEVDHEAVDAALAERMRENASPVDFCEMLRKNSDRTFSLKPHDPSDLASSDWPS
jgi:hypothetical protein